MEFEISSDDFNEKMFPLYEELYSIGKTKTFSDAIVTINRELGLVYLSGDRYSYKYKIIDNTKFFLAKIKYGI